MSRGRDSRSPGDAAAPMKLSVFYAQDKKNPLLVAFRTLGPKWPEGELTVRYDYDHGSNEIRSIDERVVHEFPGHGSYNVAVWVTTRSAAEAVAPAFVTVTV